MGVAIIHIASQLLVTAVSLNTLMLQQSYGAGNKQQLWNIVFENDYYSICNDHTQTCLGVMGDNVQEYMQVGLYRKAVGIGFLQWKLNEIGSTEITALDTTMALDVLDNTNLIWLVSTDHSNSTNPTNQFKVVY